MYMNTIRGGLESDLQVGTGNLALGREFWKSMLKSEKAKECVGSDWTQQKRSLFYHSRKRRGFTVGG